MPFPSDSPTELGPAVRALAAGQVVFERYELRRKLGEGGFGAVWLVEDTALSEEIALKFVLQAVAASPEAIDALKGEAARSRRLSHPHIVRIHDFVSDAVRGARPDLAGISMEFVDGESLAERRLREPGKCFDVEQIAPWIDQLCQALTYAHAPKRQVIHRDLKPANLLLTADGELKVADFGIACSLINSMTQISGRLSSGTPPFMSPQQLGGDWPSESDDVYSLGATIYTLLTGTAPFFQGDIIDQVKHKVPSPMDERRKRLGIATRAEIPGEWEETIAACLSKDDTQRPGGAETVAQRLGLRRSFAPPEPAPRRELVRVSREPTDEGESPTAPVASSASTADPLRGVRFAPPAPAAGLPITPRLTVDSPAQGTPQPAAAPRTGPAAATKNTPFENSLGMRFVPVAGTKVLFCPHATRVQDYQTFATEMRRTLEEPGFRQGPTHPVVNVSWEDAAAFCAWLSKREDRTYRLPTDAEWSAAVGLTDETGSTPAEKNSQAPGYPWGPTFPPPRNFGNFGMELQEDSFGRTLPVGSFAPNRFGLYDLSGNVWEWCVDWYDEKQTSRVLRGGSWHSNAEVNLRSSCRICDLPSDRSKYRGFRCVLVLSGG